MSDPQQLEIVVRGPNWLGDLVMSTPGLRSLRKGFPHARITLQVRPGLEDLLKGSTLIDQIQPVQSYHKGMGAMWAEAQRQRKDGRFDLGICLPDSFSSALLMKLSGVGKVVGYARSGRTFLLDQAVRPSLTSGKSQWVAREKHVLDLMLALECPEAGTHLSLPVLDSDKASVRQILKSHGVAFMQADSVALAPGASFGSSKCWPVEHFARVGDALSAAGARIFLVGSANESKLTGDVKAAMSSPSVDLAGALSIGELKALIQSMNLVIANDAGSRHIATALGVPSIIFFGSTSVEKTPLNLETVRVFERTLECRPCYKRVCPIPGHPCLSAIEPEPVFDAALAVLQGRGSPLDSGAA
ncbi:MAG: lipopolysaccharide heptosyltransferase II [Deltaproteobacteria bacterium]|nr:lipopolysaccharide heptosyltransferase II [Deltaproteobacteria bacterium]